MPIQQNFITKTHSETHSLVVNLHAVELSRRTKAPVVDDLAVSDIHSVDHLHLFLAQDEIPDGKVFLHPIFMHCPRDRRDSPLQMPPENNLRGGFAMVLCDLYQCLMMKDILLSF